MTTSRKWEIRQHGSHFSITEAFEGAHREVASLSTVGKGRANARLIAAAPDLLDAALRMQALIDGIFGDTPDWEDRPERDALDLAIAKATGEEL
jgi:hypothetical protein